MSVVVSVCWAGGVTVAPRGGTRRPPVLTTPYQPPWFTGPPRTAFGTRNRIGSVYSKFRGAVRGLYLPATRAARRGCDSHGQAE